MFYWLDLISALTKIGEAFFVALTKFDKARLNKISNVLK